MLASATVASHPAASSWDVGGRRRRRSGAAEPFDVHPHHPLRHAPVAPVPCASPADGDGGGTGGAVGAEEEELVEELPGSRRSVKGE